MFEYYGDTKDPEVIELVSMAVASFSNNIMDKTYMMGLSEAMRMFDGSAQPWELEGFLGNRVACEFFPRYRFVSTDTDITFSNEQTNRRYLWRYSNYLR